MHIKIFSKRKTIAHASTFGKPFKSQLDRLDAKRYYKELLKKLCCEFEARAKNLHKSQSLGVRDKGLQKEGKSNESPLTCLNAKKKKKNRQQRPGVTTINTYGRHIDSHEQFLRGSHRRKKKHTFDGEKE